MLLRQRLASPPAEVANVVGILEVGIRCLKNTAGVPQASHVGWHLVGGARGPSAPTAAATAAMGRNPPLPARMHTGARRRPLGFFERTPRDSGPVVVVRRYDGELPIVLTPDDMDRAVSAIEQARGERPVPITR